MRRMISLVLCVLLVVPFVTASGQADPVASANWLREQQAENGSFGDEVGATAFAVMAFAAVDEENVAALDWLAQQPFAELGLDELSLSLVALVAANVDVSSFADGELLANYSEQLRDTETASTDQLCLGLLARFVIEVQISESLIDRVLMLQAETGGFAVNTATDPDIVTTALCTQVLAVTEQDAATESALAFIRSSQMSDGGWAMFPESETSDPLATAFVMQALIAAGQSFSDWQNPERTLIEFADAEGAFIFADGTNRFFNEISTAVAIPVFQGLSMLSFSPAMQIEEDTPSDIPLLDANWKLVGDGFQIELNTADDFFTTVVDPFTNEELYGVEIINWTTEYPYTGYIVEQYLTADIILWMAEQDATVLENISSATLANISADELARLPADVQARAGE